MQYHHQFLLYKNNDNDNDNDKTSQLNTYKIKKLKAANKMITQYEKNIEI